jgi:hypothetical protein
MQVYVNETPMDLYPGMKVRHALIKAGLLEEVASGQRRAFDAWGNEVGLDGALTAEMKISVK